MNIDDSVLLIEDAIALPGTKIPSLTSVQSWLECTWNGLTFILADDSTIDTQLVNEGIKCLSVCMIVFDAQTLHNGELMIW